MGVPYAEVIGDPIDHSRSPLIHKFWLETLGLKGDYRAVRVGRRDLAGYLESRRGDIWWRGCNVTAPLKEAAADLVGSLAGVRHPVGAVNCVVRTPLGLFCGTNTDIAGVAEALRQTGLDGATVCLIGSGGASRSVLCHLRGSPVALVRILARNADHAARLAEGFPGPVELIAIDDARTALGDASLIVNATPLGMTGKPPMMPAVIEALRHAGPDATVFDTIYAPLETELLRSARNIGLRTLNGIAMLIGQAAPAFELFFGAAAPRAHDVELRGRLAR